MSQINTISEFLLHAGTDFRAFDMARGIRPLSTQSFLDIENAQQPAPRPRQQQAWFGILFFNKQASTEHYIWFVKLPLDEKGLVIEAGKQQFLQIVVEALGQSLSNKNNPNNQLPDNPFTFIPGQQQLADFNSLCKRALNLPFSEHLDTALKYIQDPEKNDWQEVSLQGIADFCATLNSPQSTSLLLTQFASLSPQMQSALCSSMENHPLSSELSLFLDKWYRQASNDMPRVQAVIRALSQSEDKKLVSAFIQELLRTESAKEPVILILIAARHWRCLVDKATLTSYLELLATCGTDTFAGLYADLVQIPDTRQTMLDILRSPNKSPQLTQAIGHIFGQ